MPQRKIRLEPWKQARTFLQHHARPLEWQLFRFRFEEGDPRDVLDALEPFANPDGGFGNALEPDVRTPSSSALATALALRILDELKSDIVGDRIRTTIRYLIDTFEDDLLGWRAVPTDANAHPHAPWWHDKDGRLLKTFDGFRIIPRALILALLHRHRATVPTRWLDRLTDATLSHIDSLDVLGEGGGSDLKYVSFLAETPGVPGQERLIARVRQAVAGTVSRDPSEWSSYCITPLKAAPTPRTPGAEQISELINQHIVYLLETQTENGCWNPTWSWFGAYPDEWEIAKREWQGILTLETLTSLTAHGAA